MSAPHVNLSSHSSVLSVCQKFSNLADIWRT